MLQAADAELAAALLRCATACHHCAASCLREPDLPAMAQCIAQDLSCAGMCELTAAAVARRCAHVGAMRALCAQLCDACAQECARHAHDHCQACAQACRVCAEACRGETLASMPA